MQHSAGSEQVEGRKRKISRNPKQKNRHTQGTNPDFGQGKLRQFFFCEVINRLAGEPVCQKWKENNAERIHGPGRLQVSMQKLM